MAANRSGARSGGMRGPARDNAGGSRSRRHRASAPRLDKGRSWPVTVFCSILPSWACAVREASGMGSGQVVIVIVVIVIIKVVEEVEEVIAWAREREPWRAIAEAERGKPIVPRAHLVEQGQRALDLGKQSRFLGLGR